MAGTTGFEPATTGSTVRCANQLRHVPTCFHKWSERRELNPRPFGPEPNALPGCATLRMVKKNGFQINRMAGQSQSESNEFFMKMAILLYFMKGVL